MKFTLEINLENAAFEVEGHEQDEAVNGFEIARILNRLAKLAESSGPMREGDGGKLRDVNGNTCGRWQIS
jgi:hypothetical protein